MRSATRYNPITGTLYRISIHALRAECDVIIMRLYLPSTRFQSTHSVRSATLCQRPLPPLWEYFNPRTPCGVRLILSLSLVRKREFQSTHSVRSATYPAYNAQDYEHISIHALRAECDQINSYKDVAISNFNPRTPCGVRPLQHSQAAV